MNRQKINVNQQSLDTIIKTLADLQELGGNATDDIWLLGDGHVKARKLPQSLETLRPELLDTLDAMKRVESMMITFRELARSCERKLRSLKRELRPSFMHCGIQMLPDEILSHIFSLLAHGIIDGEVSPDDYGDNKATSPGGPEVVLSHVSSRFRSICLNTPSLWSRLSSGMSTQCIETRLERSRNSLLTIVIHDYSFERLQRELVTLHAPRWRILRIFTSDSWGNHLINWTQRQLQNHLKGLRLPELESVTIGRGYGSLLQGWDMPKLHHIGLHTSDILPLPTPKPVPLHNIRSFSLSFVRYDADVEALAEFLASLPSLDELHLAIGKHKKIRFNHKVTLPRITYFSVGFSGEPDECWFMHLLHMPSLVRLQLDIGIMEPFEYYEPNSWSGFVPGGEHLSVKEVNIIFREERNNDIEVHDIFLMFPGVETLVLDTPNNLVLNVLDHWRNNIVIPPLRSLSVSHQSMTFLNKFVRAMKWSGRWGGFETLQIEGSWLLSRQEVEDLIYQNKLEFNEFDDDKEGDEGWEEDDELEKWKSEVDNGDGEDKYFRILL